MKRYNIWRILDVILTILMAVAIIAFVFGMESKFFIVVSNLYFAAKYGIVRYCTDGVLKIDSTSNPDKDTWLFELKDLNVIKWKNIIVLKIDRDAILPSQKKPA